MKEKSKAIAVSAQCLINSSDSPKVSAVEDNSSKYGDQKEVERRYGLKEAFLERDRWDGKHGIPFYKIGRKVLYSFAEIERYIEQRRQMSTSDVRRTV
jgi:hypothetical protein